MSVCIEAPREAMTEVLRKHDGVRALFDNRWLYLFALDDSGAMAWQYAGNLEWVSLATKSIAPPRLKLAAASRGSASASDVRGAASDRL